MADYTITLTLNEEQRSLLDEARGTQDITDYALEALLRTVDDDLTDYITPTASGLTSVDHIRMAEEARADGISVDELERLVWEGIYQQRVAHQEGLLK